jgi:hypothetical protein
MSRMPLLILQYLASAYAVTVGTRREEHQRLHFGGKGTGGIPAAVGYYWYVLHFPLIPNLLLYAAQKVAGIVTEGTIDIFGKANVSATISFVNYALILPLKAYNVPLPPHIKVFRTHVMPSF